MEPGDLSGAILDGRYRVIERIAEGAMGVVYRAERLKLGRVVAIKVLHDELPNELSSRKRFEIEAMAMAKLEHPHCASVLDVGIHEDRPFVVMDFVSGSDLKGLIKGGPVPVLRAVEIVRQVLSGLAHAHEHGIIHRDIKPANIVLSQKAGLGDHVKILDFGLARLNETSSITAGIVVGTPSYMAPEQIRGIAIDHRTDLYSCGVLLFELLTGKKPFHSPKDDPVEVCSMHLNQPPPRLADIQPGIEFGDLETIVARALSKLADTRYASAVEFAAAIDAVVPRRGMLTPLAGVPIVGSATASGWAFTTTPGVGAAGPAPGATPAAVTGPVPVIGSGSISAPVTPPAPGGAGSAPVPDGSAAAPPPGDSAPRPEVSAQPEVSASVEPVTGEAPTAPAGPWAWSRKQLAIAGGGALGLVLLIALIASVTGGSAPQVAVVADAAVVAPPPRPASPVDEQLVRADDLVATGRPDTALELLLSARRVFPTDARLPYAAGKLYFAKFWFTAGLRQFRDSLQLDPAYRTDPELIRIALRGFITDRGYNAEIARFLREDIGGPAKSFLEETASTHPSRTIRDRAAAELRRYR